MAVKSTPSRDGPVTLYLHNITRVAGETIAGRVDLDFALALEDNLEHLRIRLTGTIHGNMDDGDGGFNRQTIIVFREEIGLWDQGTAFPEPGARAMPCPFQFSLPGNIPPSFHCETKADADQLTAPKTHVAGRSRRSPHVTDIYRRATISYALDVVGERAGHNKKDRRIRRLISIVPAASQNQILTRDSLMKGWDDGPWRDFIREEKLRQGIWGDYSRARLKITIPRMDSYPIATAIPFSLHVETETKPMQSSHAPVDKHGKALFPALPTSSSDVKLAVRRRSEIRVRNYREHREHVDEDFVPVRSWGT
ncbi:hypothetical protein K438DRAFT_1758465 [Mycena galopus ATCC 62051]|nr:hypothetical protein K438DRAFT_1758465 [Mycena galopus ATCC 62051]